MSGNLFFWHKVITKKIAEQVTKRKTNKNTTSWGFSELDHLDKAQQTKEQWLLSNESLIRTKLWIFVKYTARQVVTRLSRMICFYWLRHSRSIPEKVSNKLFFCSKTMFLPLIWNRSKRAFVIWVVEVISSTYQKGLLIAKLTRATGD